MNVSTKMSLYYYATFFVLLSMVSGLSKKAIASVMSKKMNVVSVVIVSLHVVVVGMFLKALLSNAFFSKRANFENKDKDIAEKLYSHDPLV